MTIANPCTDVRLPTYNRTHSRLSTVLAWLAARLECGAQARARRKARQLSEGELSRLPQEVRKDLGVSPSRVAASPLVSGLSGLPQHWLARRD